MDEYISPKEKDALAQGNTLGSSSPGGNTLGMGKQLEINSLKGNNNIVDIFSI